MTLSQETRWAYSTMAPSTTRATEGSVIHIALVNIVHVRHYSVLHIMNEYIKVVSYP